MHVSNALILIQLISTYSPSLDTLPTPYNQMISTTMDEIQPKDYNTRA